MGHASSTPCCSGTKCPLIVISSECLVGDLMPMRPSCGPCSLPTPPPPAWQEEQVVLAASCLPAVVASIVWHLLCRSSPPSRQLLSWKMQLWESRINLLE